MIVPGLPSITWLKLALDFSRAALEPLGDAGTDGGVSLQGMQLKQRQEISLRIGWGGKSHIKALQYGGSST